MNLKLIKLNNVTRMMCCCMGMRKSREWGGLFIDAFSGDAIPVHPLTREAMRIYTDKLADGGVLAIHVSNMYLDLLPVCSALVADAGCVGMYRNDLDVSPRQAAGGKSPSQWVIAAKSGQAWRHCGRIRDGSCFRRPRKTAFGPMISRTSLGCFAGGNGGDLGIPAESHRTWTHKRNKQPHLNEVGQRL